MARGKVQTRADWLACQNPMFLLTVLSRNPASNRRRRLLACAATRHVWDRLDEYFHTAVENAERYADGQMSQMEFGQRTQGLHDAIMRVWWSVDENTIGTMTAARFRAPYVAVEEATRIDDDIMAPGKAMDWVAMLAPRKVTNIWQCDLLREMFGSPFRPITVNPTWLIPTVIALAQAIYDDRAFDRMPILADALEDAGCTNQDILQHCRSGGEHVRGCWVVDLLLGKE
jgi:hypothetical protein